MPDGTITNDTFGSTGSGLDYQNDSAYELLSKRKGNATATAGGRGVSASAINAPKISQPKPVDVGNLPLPGAGTSSRRKKPIVNQLETKQVAELLETVFSAIGILRSNMLHVEISDVSHWFHPSKELMPIAEPATRIINRMPESAITAVIEFSDPAAVVIGLGVLIHNGLQQDKALIERKTIEYGFNNANTAQTRQGNNGSIPPGNGTGEGNPASMPNIREFGNGLF